MIETIAENIRRVQDTIADACARSNRDPQDITIVAVSKRHSEAAILAAIEAGMQHLGENRVEEAGEKIPSVNRQLAAPPIWHMVGHIQSRKAKFIPPLFQMVHSIDNLKLAEKLSQLMVRRENTLDVLLEMNVSGEETKYGYRAHGWQDRPAHRENLWHEVRQIIALPGLQVRGLMTMAPIVEHIEAARPVFINLTSLRNELANDLQVSLPELSMGMTDDYPVAIEEGATIVRIGRAIFGPRP